MTDTKFLTKAELLAGKDTTVDVPLPTRCGACVKIRPLTSGEYNQVVAKKLKGIKQNLGGGRRDVDLGDTSQAEFDGNVLLITMAMVGEPWTESDVKALPQADFLAILKGILIATGISKEKQEEIAEFRNQR